MDWAEKYRPRRLQDLVGNSPAVKATADWGRSWGPGRKPLLLYGKPGTGKTSAAHALAHDLGWEVLELNASDQRTIRAVFRWVVTVQNQWARRCVRKSATEARYDSKRIESDGVVGFVVDYPVCVKSTDWTAIEPRCQLPRIG